MSGEDLHDWKPKRGVQQCTTILSSGLNSAVVTTSLTLLTQLFSFRFSFWVVGRCMHR